MKRIIVAIVSLLLSISMCIGFAMPAFAYENTDKQIESAIEIKDATDLAILEAELEEFLKEHPDSTEVEQDKHLLNFIRQGGLKNNRNEIKGVGDYLPGYGNLNEAERKLALAHPAQAVKVYQAATTATNKTISVYGYNGWQDNSDAFRHCLWNALMKKSIGATAAEKWATAHEYGASGLDKEMDLHNNKIGRSIDVSGKTESQIVNSVKAKVRGGYCRRIVSGQLVATNGSGMN